MDNNSNIYKIINLFWIVISFIPFFGGMGFIFAGWRTNNTKWIDEGIFYMIPFLFLSFTIFNIYIVYSEFVLLFIRVIRSFMIFKEYLTFIEQGKHTIKTDERIQIKPNEMTEKIERKEYEKENVRKIDL